jgi:hypothetical protein
MGMGRMGSAKCEVAAVSFGFEAQGQPATGNRGSGRQNGLLAAFLWHCQYCDRMCSALSEEQWSVEQPPAHYVPAFIK